MKFAKPDLPLLFFGISAFIFFAVGGQRVFRASNDFVPVYTGARCLLHGNNPYDKSQLEQEFFAGGGHPSELPSWDIDVPVYPPSTFLALSPLGLLRFPVARLLWFLLNGCLFVTSAWLVLLMSPRSHRWLATALTSFFLVTAGILLVLGQPATFAISLVVIGSYLFLRARLLPLGALLFMLSLAVKPQIGGLIVVYFLVQRVQWRYAAVALAGALALLVSAGLMLRLQPRSADWTTTLGANLSSTLSPGGSADPRPDNQQAIGDTNLQALTSVFVTSTRGFNALAYAAFLVLLTAGILAVRQANADPDPHLFAPHLLALGALSILTLTPVYHRFYDTRLLLLSVPAVVTVYQKRRLLGTWMTAFTVLAVFSLQYRVQEYLLQHGKWQSVLQNKLLFILLLRQQILELLILFGLYLAAAVSIRFSEVHASDSELAISSGLPLAPHST